MNNHTCISCGRPTSETLRLTRYKVNGSDAAESREVHLCSDCRWKSEPFFRGWRTTYTPPFLYGRADAAAHCSNPACKKPTTNILYIGEPSSRIGWGHELYACDACLELLYSQLFGAFSDGGGPWTS